MAACRPRWRHIALRCWLNIGCQIHGANARVCLGLEASAFGIRRNAAALPTGVAGEGQRNDNNNRSGDANAMRQLIKAGREASASMIRHGICTLVIWISHSTSGRGWGAASAASHVLSMSATTSSMLACRGQAGGEIAPSAWTAGYLQIAAAGDERLREF